MNSDDNYVILRRGQIEVNTNPNARCHDGCFMDSEMVWTEWEILDSKPTEEKAEQRLKFWVDLNDYAVSRRGEEARTQFKIGHQKESV